MKNCWAARGPFQLVARNVWFLTHVEWLEWMRASSTSPPQEASMWKHFPTSPTSEQLAGSQQGCELAPAPETHPLPFLLLLTPVRGPGAWDRQKGHLSPSFHGDWDPWTEVGSVRAYGNWGRHSTRALRARNVAGLRQPLQGASGAGWRLRGLGMVLKSSGCGVRSWEDRDKTKEEWGLGVPGLWAFGSSSTCTCRGTGSGIVSLVCLPLQGLGCC